MFKIGDFSRFGQVTVKALRHYDRCGLLKPAHADETSGYRYYSAAQLPRLNRILALKDLGFTLSQIAGLLDEEVSTEKLRVLLEGKRGAPPRDILKCTRRGCYGPVLETGPFCGVCAPLRGCGLYTEVGSHWHPGGCGPLLGPRVSLQLGAGFSTAGVNDAARQRA